MTESKHRSYVNEFNLSRGSIEVFLNLHLNHLGHVEEVATIHEFGKIFFFLYFLIQLDFIIIYFFII